MVISPSFAVPPTPHFTFSVLPSSFSNSLYIYGTKDASGTYNWGSFNIAVGDEVTVEGARTTYGSTIEIVDATFISVKKALLTSKDITKVITKDAASFTVTVAQKGEGLSFESKCDWLTFEGNGYTADGKGNYTFTVNAAANTTGNHRTGSRQGRTRNSRGITQSVFSTSSGIYFACNFSPMYKNS